MVRNALKLLFNDVKGQAVKYYRTREIVKVLETTHAQELSQTPLNLWPITKQRHVSEINAALAGKYQVVDRRTWNYPHLPESLHRLHQPIVKNTPYMLRRFSETPVPRRAINLIKNAIVALDWEIDVKQDKEKDEEIEKQIRIVTNSLKKPNKSDSFGSLLEAVVEDILIGGYGCIEPALTPSPKRPFKLWPVDGSTIRIFADWTEANSADSPKYAQMTGLRGEHGFVTFRDDELIYIRDNVRTSTPFGLGKLETVFNTVNSFLTAQDAASNAGSDQIHKTFFWWRGAQGRGHLEQVKRYLRNEAEGQSKISLMQGMEKPEIVEVNPVTEEDLLLAWQEFLIRIIATGFELSPQNFGLERDVNRNTSETMATSDFRSAVVPIATKVQDALTRFLLNEFLEWKDIEFKFIGLEDPDILTKAKLAQIMYQCDAIDSNEFRKKFGDEDKEGGWHDLTIEQKKMIQQQQGIKAKQDQLAQQQQQMGMEDPSMGMDQGFGSSGFGGFNDMMSSTSLGLFSAAEIASMDPDEIETYRQMGAIPDDPAQIKQGMEEEQAGILETLSEEVLEYFDYLEKVKKKANLKPAKVSRKDETEQLKKFKKRQKDRKASGDPKSKNKYVRPDEQTIDRRFQ